uniref:Secreted protein n=1 Tax=Anabas testudineus TaxID=64144 RepID=A0A3Q1JEW9_ANATE
MEIVLCLTLACPLFLFHALSLNLIGTVAEKCMIYPSPVFLMSIRLYVFGSLYPRSPKRYVGISTATFHLKDVSPGRKTAA